MSLKDSLPNAGEIISESFFQVMLDHFPWFNETGRYAEKPVELLHSEMYRGDFHGLLAEMDIPPIYFRIVTEFNGLRCPLDYDGTLKTIKVPSYTDIQRILSVHEVET